MPFNDFGYGGVAAGRGRRFGARRFLSGANPAAPRNYAFYHLAP